jgi:hypothetical protein
MAFMSQTTDRAAEVARDTAMQARASLIDLGAQGLRFLNDLRDTRVRAVDGLLGHMGLQRRESSIRPVLWFALGAAAAGAVVLVVAPSSGKALRRRLSGWLREVGDDARRAGREYAKEAVDTVASATNGT